MAELPKRFEVDPAQVTAWKDRLLAGTSGVFGEPGRGYGFASRKSFTIGTMMGMRCINVT